MTWNPPVKLHIPICTKKEYKCAVHTHIRKAAPSSFTFIEPQTASYKNRHLRETSATFTEMYKLCTAAELLELCSFKLLSSRETVCGFTFKMFRGLNLTPSWSWKTLNMVDWTDNNHMGHGCLPNAAYMTTRTHSWQHPLSETSRHLSLFSNLFILQPLFM